MSVTLPDLVARGTAARPHTNMHPIQCACGAIRGTLEGAGTCNRVICYCPDCRAFARFLGRADLLDDRGGSEIVQVAQSRLRFSKGEVHLAAVRLSEKGMVRWYASCCKTPLGNTMSDSKISFIGLIHSCLDRTRMDQDFGRNVALLNTDTAIGEPKPKQRGSLGVIARFLWIIATGRLSRSHKHSALFSAQGHLRVEPRVLRPDELADLKSAA
jgi:hypothetical protein